MRTLSLVTLSLILAAPACCMSTSKTRLRAVEEAARQAVSSTSKNQTYKLPKLLHGQADPEELHLGQGSKTKRSPSVVQSPVSIHEAYRVFVSGPLSAQAQLGEGG